MWERIRVRVGRVGILAGLLWRASPRRFVALVVLAVAQGLQPTAIILETGALVAAVPPAVRDGFGAPAGQRALWILALLGVTFVAGAILQAVASAQVRILDNAYAGQLHDTIAKATLGSPDLSTLEDPTIADEIAALEEFERADNFVGVATQGRVILQNRVTGLSTSVILFLFAWWAPIVLFAGWRLMIFATYRIVEHGIELGSSVSHHGMRRSRYLRGLAIEPGAAKELRIFGLGQWVIERYADSWQGSMREIWQNRLKDELGILGAVVVVTGVHVAVLAAIGFSGYSGAIAVAQVVVLVQAVLANEALGWFGDIQWMFTRHLVIAGQVRDLERRLSAPPRPRTTPRRGPVEVRLDDVQFTYRGRENPTLDGLALTIPQGQSTAIVGENGAGKTTLIKLLCGLYEPDHGSIRLDDAAPRDARDRVGVIFQDFVRYELPLRDNVGFGNLALTEDHVLVGALRDAGATDILDALPNGLDTTLGRGYPGGMDLSGGQWQKVALARALTAIRGGAGLLILDEPTASLDVRAETELFDRFLELTRETTTVLVSHRLASVRHADRIVVLEGGRITEDGSHDELMRLGGTYARMFSLQAERFADEAGADA